MVKFKEQELLIEDLKKRYEKEKRPAIKDKLAKEIRKEIQELNEAKRYYFESNKTKV